MGRRFLYSIQAMLRCNISDQFPDNVPDSSGPPSLEPGTAQPPRVAPTSTRREDSLFKLAPDFGQGLFFVSRGPVAGQRGTKVEVIDE